MAVKGSLIRHVRTYGAILKSRLLRRRIPVIANILITNRCNLRCFDCDPDSFNRALEDMPLAVVDLDRTPASRELVQSFLVTDAFAPAGYPASAPAATEWLQSGRARIALVVPEGFQRDLARGEAPAVLALP